MKLVLVILVMLSTAFVVSEATCVRYCYLKRVYVLSCWPCRYVPRYRYVCTYYGYCGKRSTQPNIEVGYPCNFAQYDTNKNGKIDPREFKTALRMQDSASLQKLFKRWDKNGDGMINCREFMTSEHDFECKPKGCKST